MRILEDVDRWPRVVRSKGDRKCRVCGEPFHPRPRQKLDLCLFHEERHQQRRAVENQRQWRRRQRVLARAYNAAVGPQRSRQSPRR